MKQYDLCLWSALTDHKLSCAVQNSVYLNRRGIVKQMRYCFGKCSVPGEERKMKERKKG